MEGEREKKRDPVTPVELQSRMLVTSLCPDTLGHFNLTRLVVECSTTTLECSLITVDSSTTTVECQLYVFS